MTVFLKSFGCSKNFSENQELERRLNGCGCTAYHSPGYGDRVFAGSTLEYDILTNATTAIIQTCSISGDSELANQIGFIKRLQKLNKKTSVIVTGCSLGNRFSIFFGLENVIFLKKPEDILKFARDRERAAHKKRAEEIHSQPQKIHYILLKNNCQRRCSYCACSVNRHIDKKNVSFRKVLLQIRRCQHRGSSRIEFGGPCVGDWRDPENPDFRFIDLLGFILKATDLTIDFLELHPLNLNKPMINLLKNQRIGNKGISIPVQSASNRLLKLMRRGYKLQYLDTAFNSFFEALPGREISTDIILGFPGETAKDIGSTLDFLERYPFSRIDVYPYSPRYGTMASTLDPIPISRLTRHYSIVLDRPKLANRLNILFTIDQVTGLRTSQKFEGRPRDKKI